MAEVSMFQRVTWSVRETCQMTGLGVTSIYARLKSGTLKSSKQGDKRLINVASVLAMLAVDRDGNPIEGKKPRRHKTDHAADRSAA